MATKTFEELKQMAIQIRDEKTNKQNTATRIGTQMLEHLNKLEQEYYNKENINEQNKQTDVKFSELEEKIGEGVGGVLQCIGNSIYKITSYKIIKGEYIDSEGSIVKGLNHAIINVQHVSKIAIKGNDGGISYSAFYNETGEKIGDTFQVNTAVIKDVPSGAATLRTSISNLNIGIYYAYVVNKEFHYEYGVLESGTYDDSGQPTEDSGNRMFIKLDANIKAIYFDKPTSGTVYYGYFAQGAFVKSTVKQNEIIENQPNGLYVWSATDKSFAGFWAIDDKLNNLETDINKSIYRKIRLDIKGFPQKSVDKIAVQPATHTSRSAANIAVYGGEKIVLSNIKKAESQTVNIKLYDENFISQTEIFETETIIPENFRGYVNVGGTKTDSGKESFVYVYPPAAKELYNMANFLYGKSLKVLGDSLSDENAWDYPVWSEIISAKNFMELQNLAVSGSCLSYNANTNVGIPVEKSCVGLSKTLVDGDYILIWGGTNDGRFATLGDIESEDNTTIYGALKEILTTLQINLPKANIGLITPFNNTNEVVQPQVKYVDIVKAMKEVGALYSVPVLDLFNCSGINWATNGQAGQPLREDDLYHLSQAGQEYIAAKINGFLLSMNSSAISAESSQGNGSGGNVILEWKTDVATTRKQVPLKDRQKLLQISYENADGDVINEQYIGTELTDIEWVRDENWEQLVSEKALMFDKKANELIVDNLSTVINSGYHNTATSMQANSGWSYTNMFEVYPNSIIYCNIECRVYFYRSKDKNTYYQSNYIALNVNQQVVVPKDCFFMLITYQSSNSSFSIKYKYDFNTNVAELQKGLNTLDECTVKYDILADDKYVQYSELTLNDGYKSSADTVQNIQGWKYTDKIPVFAESKLHTNKGIRVLFYRNVLDSSYIDKAVKTVTANTAFDVPKETNYIIITFNTNIGEDLLISYAENYYSKPAILQQQITDNTTKINAVPLSKLDETYFEINKEEFIHGFITTNGDIQTGDLVATWGYCETYFSVSSQITYNLIKEIFTTANIIEYDKYLNVLNYTKSVSIFTPQENTHYVRITASNFTLEGAKIKLLYNGIFFKPSQDHFLTDLQKSEMQIFKKFSQGLFKGINGKAILTLVDDDCFWNNYDTPQNDMKLKTLCDERNIRCTFACITKNWTTENWQNMIEWQQQGYHFVSHSYSHWDTSTDAKLEEEFAHPLSDLTKNGAVHCDYFVYPFGGLSGQDDKVNRLSQKYYKCSVTTTEGINRYADRNRFQLFRLMYLDSLTDEKFNGYIDDLSANGGWLIFGSHSGDSRATYWDTERYKTMLDYALSKGNIEVMTLYEAWEFYKLYYMYKDIFIE